MLARELAVRIKGLDYAYLTVCVYLSSWICWLSSSIPLLLNTDGNFLIETGVLQSTIPIASTLGSTLNRVYLALLQPFFLLVSGRKRGADRSRERSGRPGDR